MLICLECGEVFEEDEIRIIEEHHPYGMTYATETWRVCPYCGDSNIEKAVKCTRCGEYVSRDDIQYGEGAQELCRVCYEELYE